MTILYSGQNSDDKLINGDFLLWQRATSQTTSGLGSDDRFRNNNSGSTKTHSQQSFTVGQSDVPKNPAYYSRTVVTTASGSTDLVKKSQVFPSVEFLSGQIVTLSFYAKADASKDIATEFWQYFGSGGSPSSDVLGIGVTTHSLTTSWQKFTTTFLVTSVSGKTLGTNDDDNCGLTFYFDAGSSLDARTNSLGNQSGTFDLARIRLVPGTVDGDNIDHSERKIISDCQSYFCKSYNLDVDPGTVTSVGAISEYVTRNNAASTPGIRFPVTMKATPTVTLYSPVSGSSGVVDGGGTERTASAVTPSQSGITGISITSSATSEQINWHYTANAE